MTEALALDHYIAVPGHTLVLLRGLVTGKPEQLADENEILIHALLKIPEYMKRSEHGTVSLCRSSPFHCNSYFIIYVHSNHDHHVSFRPTSPY